LDDDGEREGWLGLGDVYILDGSYGDGGEVIEPRRYREEKVGWGEEKEEQNDSFDGTKMYDLALLIAFLIISVVFVVWRVIVEVCFNKSTLARNKSLVNKGRNGRGKGWVSFFKGRRLLIALVVTFVLSTVSIEAARNAEELAAEGEVVDGVRLKVC
jgi:hypothetical protein